jgi:hypothetical protein
VHRTGKVPYTTNSSQRFVPNRILIGGLILYAFAFAVLLRNKSFDAAGAVVVFIVFGIVFPFIAYSAPLLRQPGNEIRGQNISPG